MKAFNLEKALAGEKVITRDGQEATQIVKFTNLQQDQETIYVVMDKEVRSYYSDGAYDEMVDESRYDLFMAPKKLSGFINVYDTGIFGNIHDTKSKADDSNGGPGTLRVACIDLSQFSEGEGL